MPSNLPPGCTTSMIPGNCQEHYNAGCRSAALDRHMQEVRNGKSRS